MSEKRRDGKDRLLRTGESQCADGKSDKLPLKKRSCEVLRDGVITEIKKSHDWEKPKRHALTVPEQEAFVDFVARSPTYRHWSNSFTVLLGTGMRIGECLGLRWEGCNFKGKIINVNHTYSSSHGSREYGDPHHNPEDESRYSHYSDVR